jgi:hypothetical protein
MPTVRTLNLAALRSGREMLRLRGKGLARARPRGSARHSTGDSIGGEDLHRECLESGRH